MNKDFIKNFSLTGGVNFLIVVLALINNVVVTRWIGPEGRGVYAIISNIILFMNLLFGEGFRRSNTLVITNDKNGLSSLLLINFFYMFVLVLFGLVLIFIQDHIKIFLPNITDSVLIIGIAISIFSILWQGIQAIYLGLKNIVYFNILFLGSILLVLVFNLIGIYIFKIGLLGIFLNMLLANIFLFIIGLSGFFKYKTNNGIKISIILIDNLSLLIKSTISSIDVFIMKKSTVFFVNGLLDVSGAGFYSIANIFADLLQKIPNVAGTLIFPESAKLNSEKNYGNLVKIIRFVTLFNSIIIVVLLILGHLIISILFGDEFSNSSVVLYPMLIGLWFIAPTSIIHAFFMGNGFTKTLMIINSLAALLSLPVNYILINEMGLFGSGVSFSFIITVWSISFFIYFVSFTKTKLKDILLIRRSDLIEVIMYMNKIRNKLRR